VALRSLLRTQGQNVLTPQEVEKLQLLQTKILRLPNGELIWNRMNDAAMRFILRTVDVKTCIGCKEIFAAGIGMGRRYDATFCSDECRINHNSRKRSL